MTRVGNDDCSLWIALATAGPKATAEALTATEMKRLHVATKLEAFIGAKVREGYSVVLTGNAGDGKTHVLRRIEDDLRAMGAEVVSDATADMVGGNPKLVIDKWRRAHEDRRPFCMAANEYPLHVMRTSSDFGPLQEVSRQCRGRLAYGSPSTEEAAQDRVLVIDLSLRNPLNPEFFRLLLDRLLLDEPLVQSIAEGNHPIAKRNVELLNHGEVRRRLETLMGRMTRLGYRATVRDLWILAARMVFADGVDRDIVASDWYSERLFSVDARFDLTKALQDVDPALCSHPLWDARLEANDPQVRDGWPFGTPAIAPHPILGFKDFAALKRRFYFEHSSGEQVFDLLDDDAKAFHKLLNGEGVSGPRLVEQLIESVNAAYCPVGFNGRGNHLYLWNGHRFHEQPSRSFTAVDRVGTDAFEVVLPRLPTRSSGAFAYEADHVALVARRAGKSIRLRVDFPLFKTLRRLERGLPRKLVPERDIHRLDMFIERLGSSSSSDRMMIWSVNLEALEVISISLSADGTRYEGVQRLG